ncbi:hypothetical protein QP439_04230 [Streptococcus sp. UMB1203]|jgi:hypothetical protein|uniref:hypothetical protein n=1 Tax=Streptococcus TaxID=1301 RepID=UPI0003D38F0A|nr:MULTISPECIES: hypothetical protein [Streptococcus]ETD99258.1 hypothetical protein U758_01285 [Streptococcus mitis 27/7]MBT2174239.1 hypothetical protein [Streptococcus mitis]MDK7203523.1 hypothetical protein [Streptococcus sp. UMB1203]
MKELKFLKYATIVFMLFILFWVSFGGYILGTQGSKEDTKIVQTERLIKEESRLKAELRDAEILGKFWNSKGHFIVVYNSTTKAPEIIEVGYSEWQLMDIGELY